jgi:carbamoyl-phosphate synthase large subunit
MASNVLLTCGGRWVGLVLQLKQAMAAVPELREGRLLVADHAPLTPAGHFADQSFVVPSASGDDYMPALLELCKAEQVRVLLPHTDIDLIPVARHREEFARRGITVVCPSPAIVELCTDKLRFHAFAQRERLAMPHGYSAEALRPEQFPMFAKRRQGYGGVGATVCQSADEARNALRDDPSILLQEFIEAEEVSVDAYVASDGRAIVRVPRVRDKVVGGEAVMAHTMRDPAIIDLADRTIAALACIGFRGPLNAQLFRDMPPKLIEVNPRLGSASLLANVATGGRFFRSILRDAVGDVPDGDANDYRENVHLYRYLGDFFYEGDWASCALPGNGSARPARQ